MFRSRYSPVAVLVGLVVLILVKVSNRSDMGEEYLEKAQTIVAQIPSYQKNQEYVDWLVTDAHDHCFNESYQFDMSRRSRSRGDVDEERYFGNLFDLMIDQAKADRATQVADELAKVRQDLFN